MITKQKFQETYVEVSPGLLIVLFTYAAVSKAADYEKFIVQISQSPLLHPFAPLIAWLVPTIEILTPTLLLFERTSLSALYASFGLLVVFTGYLIAITQFSDHIPCACGGILESLTWSTHIWFNAAFLILTAVAIFLYPDVGRRM